MAASALATQLAHLTDKDIKPSILSEPLKIFEDRSALGLDNPVILGQTGSPVPRGRMWTNQPGLPSNAYTFSYNPSSIGFSTVWDTSLPQTGLQGSTFGNIQPLSPETIQFQLLMNRMVEVAPTYTGPNALLFSVYGTLCDLSVLYRTVNGLADADIDIALTNPTPGVPATNLGWLAAALCTVSFGNGDFNWSGFVTSMSINHAKFVDSMTPVLTTVDISMTRTLSAGQQIGDGSSSGIGASGFGGATAVGSQAGTANTSGGKTTGNKPTTPKTTPSQPTPSPAPAPGA